MQRYKNPVLSADFPDPCVLEVPGEGFYAYATHDYFSPSPESIQVSFSKDMVKWTDPKAVLTEKPTWARECELFWAPHVVKVGNEYRMYYSADPDTHDGMCIALAKGERPDVFTDCGRPLTQGPSYRVIDPHFFIDPRSGKHYLYYGSAHEPISVVELSSDGMTFVGSPVPVLYPDPSRQFETLREGAYMSYLPAFERYFLWVSGNNTWATMEYAVTVFWSSGPLGPFERLPQQEIPGEPGMNIDSLILRPNRHWDAPGQNCIQADAAGNDWIIYHAVDPHDRYIPGTSTFLRKMCMDRVYYTEDGWPYIRGGGPSHEEQDGPVVG